MAIHGSNLQVYLLAGCVDRWNRWTLYLSHFFDFDSYYSTFVVCTCRGIWVWSFGNSCCSLRCLFGCQRSRVPILCQTIWSFYQLHLECNTSIKCKCFASWSSLRLALTESWSNIWSSSMRLDQAIVRSNFWSNMTTASAHSKSISQIYPVAHTSNLPVHSLTQLAFTSSTIQANSWAGSNRNFARPNSSLTESRVAWAKDPSGSTDSFP